MVNIIDTKAIGKRINELRKKNKMTQEKLALETTLSQDCISKIENGNTKNIKLEHLTKIAEALDVSCDYLCFGKDTNSILELLEKYISLKYANISDGTNTYSIPILEINKPFHDYLINTAHAKNERNIPDNIREMWLEQERENFYKRNKTNEATENVESFVPVPENLVYPDDNKKEWKQQDLIREIDNIWNNKH